MLPPLPHETAAALPPLKLAAFSDVIFNTEIQSLLLIVGCNAMQVNVDILK